MGSDGSEMSLCRKAKEALTWCKGSGEPPKLWEIPVPPPEEIRISHRWIPTTKKKDELPVGRSAGLRLPAYCLEKPTHNNLGTLLQGRGSSLIN